ncbi:hypothetical protein DSO57_1027125 [Entomophthora muscae]|uniref:Uncharacterized protein n=1 Tax=Entomophthora muscae TaxID=34485 RepID=A0ACC2UNG7_9FUNG|nr:hypothetical protein DSO57_1027125 [Entomophthora muscae]
MARCPGSWQMANDIKWTGAPKNFTSYHLAPNRGPEERIVAGKIYYHEFKKTEESYWFSRRELVSFIKTCDPRYKCPLQK